jgi:hypothetical protein
MLGKLGDEVLKVEKEDPFLYVLATRGKNGEVAVLITNFPEITKMSALLRLVNFLEEEGGKRMGVEEEERVLRCASKELKRRKEEDETFSVFTADEEELTRTLLPCTSEIGEDRTRRAVQRLKEYLNLYLARKEEPWKGELAVEFSGKALPEAELWRIDDDHANVCGFNRKTAARVDEEHPCGVGGIVDKSWEEAEERAFRNAEDHLRKRGWTEAQVRLVEEEVLNRCKERSENRKEFFSCARSRFALIEEELPENSLNDLIETARNFIRELKEEERALRLRFNSTKEVSLTPETIKPASIKEGEVRFNLTLHPFDTYLIVVKPATR